MRSSWHWVRLRGLEGEDGSFVSGCSSFRSWNSSKGLGKGAFGALDANHARRWRGSDVPTGTQGFEVRALGALSLEQLLGQAARARSWLRLQARLCAGIRLLVHWLAWFSLGPTSSQRTMPGSGVGNAAPVGSSNQQRSRILGTANGLQEIHQSRTLLRLDKF